jgi:hypothetical protein
MTKKTRLAIAAVAVTLLLGLSARAQEPVGSVAALEGRAEALHPGTAEWAALGDGDPVVLGDQVRTLADSKMKLLFRDDSVLTLGANSTLTIDEQVAGEAPSSRFSLVVGALRAVVTERYGKPGSRFEVSTPTAIAGVHGTGFIATYDQTADETTVVGLFDTTLVRPAGLGPGAQEVQLAPGDATSVRRGSIPTQPSHMPENVLRGLSAATTVGGGMHAPGTSGSQNVQPNAKHPRQTAGAPQQVIDQPVSIIENSGKAGGVPPPPPPAPPPAH